MILLGLGGLRGGLGAHDHTRRAIIVQEFSSSQGIEYAELMCEGEDNLLYLSGSGTLDEKNLFVFDVSVPTAPQYAGALGVGVSDPIDMSSSNHIIYVLEDWGAYDKIKQIVIDDGGGAHVGFLYEFDNAPSKIDAYGGFLHALVGASYSIHNSVEGEYWDYNIVEMDAGSAASEVAVWEGPSSTYAVVGLGRPVDDIGGYVPAQN